MIEKLSIIIPCFNEIETLPELIKRVLEVDLGEIKKEIILVDDGSRDGTSEFIAKLSGKHKTILCQRNRGKGNAIKEGLKYVTGDYIVIQDADLEYDPNDFIKMIEPLKSNTDVVVFGSRELIRHRLHSGRMFYLGARFLTWFTNFLFASDLTDMPTCYKVIPRNLVSKMSLKCTGFEFCPEITAKILKLGYKITEVPISYVPRSVEQGKKIRLKDGLIAIWVLIRERFLG